MSETTTHPPMLIPTHECIVCERSTRRAPKHQRARWRVVERLDVDGPTPRLRVASLVPGATRVLRVSDVECGFVGGMTVQDVPMSRVDGGLGEGRVMKTRRLGGREQVLVELLELGESRWLPYENLRFITSARERFAKGDTSHGEAERLRLKTLAFAIERWHQNTGALSRLEIDPLPHQLHLVHHILSSGTLNWMIADDVGLGKTIEVGMLLSALINRAPSSQLARRWERVLIVTPAGLTQQWQEELAAKFNLEHFQIYGEDIHVHHPRMWRLYPQVIASIDRLKTERHMDMLRRSGHWDLVIFDEGHRLTRRERGSRLEASDRYALASQLRMQTDHLMLLTATPHQGKRDQFAALLELLRPEWKERFDRLEDHPELLRELIYRNRKEDVTDADGAFIFKGQTSKAVEVPISDAERALDQGLQAYFREGYARAAELGTPGRAIGFVMTVYRKLAASSHAAIARALRRRLARLRREQAELEGAWVVRDDDGDRERDVRYAGELDEARVDGGVRTEAFFEGEEELLEELIAQAEVLVPHDTRLRVCLEQLIGAAVDREPGCRFLVFTEFRATQQLLVEALGERFGRGRVVEIHGQMKMEERRDAQQRFTQGGAQFMVSTEAGGEGLNLHTRCWTMINYDLPWNPMRMVQRMGRLYRYGQKRRVLVFNLHCNATIDGRVVDLMYERLAQVSRDLSALSDEFNQEQAAEIFGELTALADIGGIVEASAQEEVERTRERIDEALERAQHAQQIQSALLGHAQGFDPSELRGQLRLEHRHVESFVRSMLDELGCEVLGSTHNRRIWTVRLSDALRDELGLRGARIRLTVHRELAHHDGVMMMDFQTPLFEHLIRRAQHHDFGGLCAALATSPSGDALVTARLRWQDDQGHMMREELVLATVHDAHVTLNDSAWIDWLADPADDHPDGFATRTPDAQNTRRTRYKRAEAALDTHLAHRASRYLHPMQIQALTCASLEDAH